MTYEFTYWVIESPAAGVSLGLRPAFYIGTKGGGLDWMQEREDATRFGEKADARKVLARARDIYPRYAMHLLRVTVRRVEKGSQR